MSPSDWISVLALVVASGALALEVRRWFESGPRLVVSVMPGAVIVDGENGQEEKDLLFVRVDNRGDATTTITNFGILRFDSHWQWLTGKHSATFNFPNPQLTGHPPGIPSELAPGQRWIGVARPRPDIIPDIETGALYVAIYANHSDRPAMKRIRKRKPAPLAGAIEAE